MVLDHCGLGKVESTLTFLDSSEKLLFEGGNAGIVWQLEIVDAGHDAGEVVV